MAPALTAAVDEKSAMAGWDELRRRLVDARTRLHGLTEVYHAANLPDIAALEERADACRSYVKESALGYCAASLTEARAALLQARLAALQLEAASKPGKSAAETKKKKKPVSDPD